MICLVCNRPSIDGLTHPGCKSRYAIDGAFCAVSYKSTVRKLIYNFKYKPYLSDLTETLVGLFYESLIQQEIFQKAYALSPILVPVPLSTKRLRKRGYNHAKLLAQGLSKNLNLKIMEVLQRVKETKTQHGLKLKDRKENLKGAFILNTKCLMPDTIFLVDDILTSGSTLLEAARILKRNGAKKVWGLTLARD